jgi:hypothetical protein
MSLPYRDADQIAEVSEFLRNGGDEQRAAAYLQVSVEDLATLLGEPQWKQIPASEPKADEFDLFAAERLDGVL